MNPINGYVTTAVFALWCIGAVALLYKVASDAHKNVPTDAKRNDWLYKYTELSHNFVRTNER